MKALTASALALALVLGSVPASAQVELGRVSLGGGVSAPTPLPAGLVPAAGALAPSLAAPALALSLSLTPAAYAPSPAPIVPAPIVVKGATPIQTLRAVASPELAPRAGEAFDGVLARSAPASVEPPVEPDPAATPVRKSLLARYKEHRNAPPTAFATFGKTVVLTGVAAAIVPIALGAAPAMKAAFAFVTMGALSFAVLIPSAIVVWAAGRLLRGPQTSAKPPPSRRLKTGLVALGLAVGLAIGAAPHYATGPIVQYGSAVLDSRLPPAERHGVKWIRGGAMEDETIKILSSNPIGRQTLDGLRDRFGVLRLPAFFVSDQKDSVAQHEDMLDGLYIGSDEIISRGWTVEQFLKSPELQRRLVREMSDTMTHELTHGVQGRRPPWNPGYFRATVEAENEAYMQETLFRIAAFEADPKQKSLGQDYWVVMDGNIDGYLKGAVSGAPYEKNVVQGNDPYYNRYIAGVRARMPELRVRLLKTMAQRAATPGIAKMYLDKARAVAKDAGLPQP